MTQSDKAQKFAGLHIKGDPVALYNIWDAGSAKAVAEAGAKAVATGSWSVAAAQGFTDGEAIPLDLVLGIVTRIALSVDAPLTVDFEGGYAEAPELIAKNVARLIDSGAIGLNFEDQRVGGTDLYEPNIQHRRIKAVRQAADESGLPLIINARTDLFLKEPERDNHASLVAEAIDRADMYEVAGASSFFVPGLVDPKLIKDICEAVSLPVNVMMMDGAPSINELASMGVARISYGPGPYFSSMADLASKFQSIS